MQKEDDAYAGSDLQGAKQSCLNKPLAKSRAFTEVYPGISYLMPAAGSGYVPCHVWWLTQETANCSAAGAQWWWSYTRSHQTTRNRNYNAVSVLTYPGVTHSVYCVSAQTCQITISFACTPWTGPTYKSHGEYIQTLISWAPLWPIRL